MNARGFASAVGILAAVTLWAAATIAFVPAPWLGSPWVAVALVAAAWLAAWRWHRQAAPEPGFSSLPLPVRAGLLAAPFLAAFVAWLALARVLPWAWTRALGTPVDWPVPAVAIHAPGRQCTHRLRLPSLPALAPLCVSAGFDHGPSGRNIRVVLVGRRTVFGVAVTGVRHGDAVPTHVAR